MPVDNSGGLPSLFKRGDVLLASHVNRIISAIMTKIIVGPGLVKTRLGTEITIALSPTFAKRGALKEMMIVSDEGDYLVCNKSTNGVANGTAPIHVLKPWLLRRTPFENRTVNGETYGGYTANGARPNTSVPEDQVITQDYFVGAVIYVRRTDSRFATTGGSFASFIDTNVDGRSWAVAAA